MPETDTDVIDTLVGIKSGSALDAIRNRRPGARNQAQASYRALFAPETPGEVAATERFAVVALVTGLASSGASEELRRAIDAAIAAAKGQVPLWLPSRRPADLPRRGNTHAPQAVVS